MVGLKNSLDLPHSANGTEVAKQGSVVVVDAVVVLDVVVVDVDELDVIVDEV